ncbi:ATP-binding cassette G family transporter [Cardiosporidium cionae]|uniref:ATP-binding cassette G family transporter n=1 Tax=Cardiosporidium cionae TaxID=476202 RepID=A0ABQ7JAB5_9APIC|nr:ATP-binding cassette G family transporter [Cardiosporidium cionae]|eukprot:KAF8820932.1 ATP-binding cassette G family transporter [Cardiosporidium cionae]
MNSITICTRKLGYVIQKKKKWKHFFRGKSEKENDLERKQILQFIDLCAIPGEVLFIMGPSGSGKTTLLNLLSGNSAEISNFFDTSRISANANAKIEGEILFNNIKADKKMISKLSNYVMQQSTLLEFLTVEETLLFNAALRMKGSSKEEQKKRVETVLDELKLNQCRKVLIGGQTKKGLSGGEKRRVSIAIELLDDPYLLFLDEPTSGLDASLAFDTLKLLVALAKHGNRTIICTIHQPRSQAFSMFDQLLLLSSGQTVFYGAAKTALDHFQELGYPCPSNFNPADFLLDLLTVCSSDRQPPQKQKSEGMSAMLRRMVTGEIVSGDVAPAIGALTNAEPELIAAEHTSALGFHRQSITQEELDSLPKRFQASERNAALQKKLAEASAIGAQPTEISRMLQAYTGKWNTWLKQTYVLTQRGLKNSLRNPIAGIAQLCISIITALILDLTRNFSHFLLVLAIGSLVVYAASSFMYCVGTLSPNLNVAQAIAPVVLVIFMLVSGFYLRDPDIPVRFVLFK